MEPIAFVMTASEVAQVLRDYAVAKLKLDQHALDGAHVRCNWREDGPAAIAIVLLPVAPVASDAR